MTFMATEIRSTPATVSTLLTASDQIDQIGKALSNRRFSFAVICGRGSSSHAGVYFRYLIETMLGYSVSNAAPSVVTGYGQHLSMRDALFIVISQSGRSPDLVAATKSARSGGALTLAIVNDPDSPAARAADITLPILAGREQAVAATKTVINTLAACAYLTARWASDATLESGVKALPDRLDKALDLDWTRWTAPLRDARCAYVTGRGIGYGPAREIALKLSETVCMPALSFSTAELMHGPRAALTHVTPVLTLRQADALASSIDRQIEDLRLAGVPIEACGGPHGTLPWIGDGHPACDPITMMVPAYLAMEAETRRRGLDPDSPPHLNKVTETL